MERRVMNLLNAIGFFVIGIVLVFTVLFVVVCVFDRMMEESFKLEKRDEWNTEEIERNAS
jgi:Na+-transporting methylmalonyl-CoA/oxaloacetate decarboxylase gamma subunit